MRPPDKEGTPRKYPMIVRKVCPFCGKGNDILINRWQDNRPRMFCPGTNHAALSKKKRGQPDAHNFTEEVIIEEEVDKKTYRAAQIKSMDEEYVAQLRKSYNLA